MNNCSHLVDPRRFLKNTSSAHSNKNGLDVIYVTIFSHYLNCADRLNLFLQKVSAKTKIVLNQPASVPIQQASTDFDKKRFTMTVEKLIKILDPLNSFDSD